MAQTHISIPAGNETLSAFLTMPPGDGSAPLVVTCHGLTGTRVGTCYRFVRLARRLATEGIACLRFDFRGCGESDGRFENLSPPRLIEDLLAVLDAARDRVGVDPTRLGLVGSSFGAFTIASASDRVRNLKCAVFWAPVADARKLVDRDMNQTAWQLLRRQGWLDHNGHRLGAAFFDNLPDADGPSILASRACPLLVYHGAGERQVPIEHGRAYERAIESAGVEASLHELDVEDHGMRSVAANDAILDGTVAWLRRFLLC